MGRTFGSIDEFEKFLLGKCVTAVDSVKGEVHGKFQEKLGKYYSEFSPEEYIRTGALRGSLNEEGAFSTGSGARARVYFSTPSYAQGMVPLQHTPEHGRYGWATWSGEQVLDSAMDGSHGGYVDGTPIWSSVMSELGGAEGIKTKLKKAMGV